MLAENNIKEIRHLESINSFYVQSDYMDELMMDREVDIIKRYYKSNSLALEIGCGSGSCTTKLVQTFENIEVVEPAKKNIEMLKTKLPNITCHETLLEKFCSNKQYDFVFFLNVIEHVRDPISSLITINNLLKCEGLVFISCPNCMCLNRRAGYKMGLLDDYKRMAPKDMRVGHRRLYTVKMLEDHCEQAGLRVISIKGMYLKPLSEQQMISLGDDVIRAFYWLGEDIPEYCASLLAIATKKYY